MATPPPVRLRAGLVRQILQLLVSNLVGIRPS